MLQERRGLEECEKTSRFTKSGMRTNAGSNAVSSSYNHRLVEETAGFEPADAIEPFGPPRPIQRA